MLVNDYLLFARVRRCIPSESGFTIGVERIDDWDRPFSGSALVPQKIPATSPVNVLGRPKLPNPLDSSDGAAHLALFADPRLLTRKTKYQAVAAAAGCIALAGWAGFGVGALLHGKPHGAAPARTAAAKQVPDAPTSTAPGVPLSVADAAPAKPAAASLLATRSVAANVVAGKASSPAAVAPPLQKARVEEPPVQKAEVVAVPKLTARSATGPASKISLKANDVSRVTACADGARVLNRLLTKGYAGEVPFSRQAIVRFGNAGAIKLAVGNQPAARLTQMGAVRAIKVTPTGYEPITVPTTLDCSLY